MSAGDRNATNGKELPPEVCAVFRIRSSDLIATRDYSVVFRCRSDLGELAVKRCVLPRTLVPNPQAARREYLAMQRLHAEVIAVGSSPLAPRPIGCLERHGIVVMTWEPGVTMTELLLRPFGGLRSAASCGRIAGEWLRRFHQLQLAPERANDFQTKALALEERFAQAGILKDSLLGSASRLLRQRASVASAIAMPASWVHGDFKSDNLLVNGKMALGLDAQIEHENTVIFDIAPFLVHLDLLRWTPRGLLCQQGLDAAVKGFLAGYGDESREWTLPIAWLVCEMVSQRYSAVISRPTRVVDRARWLILRRVLERSLGRLRHTGS